MIKIIPAGSCASDGCEDEGGPAASGYYPCQQISSIKQRHFITANTANILSQVLQRKQLLRTKHIMNIDLKGHSSQDVRVISQDEEADSQEDQDDKEI